MKVKNFVNKYIQPNSLIRLWWNNKEEVVANDKPFMDWQLVKSKYKDKNVIGVTDIYYVGSSYAEAINLVIEQ